MENSRTKELVNIIEDAIYNYCIEHNIEKEIHIWLHMRDLAEYISKILQIRREDA